MALFPSTSIPSAAGGYDIDNSCRFEKAGETKLQGTIDHSANYTVSCWVKRCNLSGGAIHYVWRFNGEDQLQFSGTDLIVVERKTGITLTTARKMRDPSAWYHIVVQAGTNILKIFVNGVEHDYADGGTYTNRTGAGAGAQTGSTFVIGSSESNSAQHGDLYIAEFHFCDNLALDANSFGEFDEDYGHWKPKKYADSHGSNGFYMDFADASAFGNDVSGNNNDLAQTNLAAHDQMLDSPTNNFAVISNLDGDIDGSDTFREGNLRFKNTANSNASHRRATFSMDSGKWYWEVLREDSPGEQGASLGIMASPQGNHASVYIGSTNRAYANLNKGIGILGSGTTNAGGNTINGTAPAQALDDVIQWAYDTDTGKLWLGFNGTWRNSGNPAAGTYPWATATNYATIKYAPAFQSHNNVSYVANFGQDGTFAGNIAAGNNADDEGYGNFKHDVPAGFLALCSKNLPTPAVKPKEHFNVKLYDDGAGAKTGVGFQPDLVWVKARGSTYGHRLTDAVRGVTKAIDTDAGAVEATDSTGLTAFGADGFTVGADTDYSDTTGDGMVAWCWKGGNATSGTGDFTQGSIASTCSRNVAGGFSIVSYTGTGSAGTVGHGLSVAPNLVIARNRDLGRVAVVGSLQLAASMDFTDYIALPGVDPKDDNDGMWDDTEPTASVFSVKTIDNTNASTNKYIAYCFHNVEGYSKFGAYVGNGNADGTFIYCGFSPRYILTKPIQASSNWHIYDSARFPYNPTNLTLSANLSGAEGANDDIDILSNGFKTRRVTSALSNNNEYYLYMAFAETPFKNATAR